MEKTKEKNKTKRESMTDMAIQESVSKSNRFWRRGRHKGSDGIASHLN